VRGRTNGVVERMARSRIADLLTATTVDRLGSGAVMSPDAIDPDSAGLPASPIQ
jgi:hypothetical protein